MRWSLGKEPEPRLAAAFRDIRDLRVEVAYPLILEMYDDYRKGQLSLSDFTDAVRYIESYVFRRAVCSIPTNSLNNTFATFSRALKKDRYLESMLFHFLQMPSYRRFPNDEEFSREIKVRNLYSNNRASYWLRRLENHDRKEPVPVDEYTVEHILPRTRTYRKPGRNHRERMEKYPGGLAPHAGEPDSHGLQTRNTATGHLRRNET